MIFKEFEFFCDKCNNDETCLWWVGKTELERCMKQKVIRSFGMLVAKLLSRVNLGSLDVDKD